MHKQGLVERTATGARTQPVVTVRAGLLSQTRAGEKWQERATRKCPIHRAPNIHEAESRWRFGMVVHTSGCRNAVSRRRRPSPLVR
jgi:hypothetical protein